MESLQVIIASTAPEFTFLLKTLIQQNKNATLIHARTHEKFVCSLNTNSTTFEYTATIDNEVFNFNIIDGYMRGDTLNHRSLQITNFYFVI